ncbi:hypothetical protein SRHO_G00073230 [Serrasalmus rhombeus]
MEEQLEQNNVSGVWKGLKAISGHKTFDSQAVFVESLLCSGHEENVKLAGQLMQRSAVSQDVSVSAAFRGKATPRVAYTRSVELVLASAREYFNSSATLTDPCINLARPQTKVTKALHDQVDSLEKHLR